MTLKQKFDSIDQSKLNSDQKDFLGKIEKATKNFTSDNKEVNNKVEGALDKMIATFKEKMPEVIKTKESKKEPKSSSKSSRTSKPKRTVMSVAKEIRKDGESWADAQKRARAEINKDKKSAEKEVKTEMQKLMAFIKTRKELEGISGTDLGRDSSRSAKKRGARVVTHSGSTSNQYGTYENKLGRKYWESRDRHSDRLAPNYPKDAPLLENGAYLTDPNFGAFQAGIYKKGGMLSPRERYNLEIKGMTGVSVGAIEKYIDENDLNDNDVLNIVVGLGRKQLNGADVSTAMVGKKGNAESKRLIRFVKDNKAMKMELGGNVGGYDLAGHLDGTFNVGQNDGALSGVSGTQYSGLVGETGAMSSGEMFENGGNVGGYDLAGHLDGTLNVGQNDGDLSGVTGTQYSGLVGETGAMSSGEMFARGGKVKKDAEYSNMGSLKTIATDLTEEEAIKIAEKESEKYPQLQGFIVFNGNSFMVKRQFSKDEEYESIKKSFEDGLITKSEYEELKKETESKYFNGGDFQAGVYAEGGSLENHGIKEGDTFIKTISGGIQKVKDKDGKIVFINLATGERDSQPPLPFDDGGEVTYFVNKDGIRVRSVAKPDKELSEKEWMEKHSESNEARAYAEGGDIEAFSMRMVKGSGAKPTEVLTDEKSVKFAGGGSLREKRNEYLSKLGDKEADVWDKIGAQSGSQIRGDKKMLKAYAEAVEEMLIDENVQGRSFDQEDYDFYTDENWHLFNDFLVWNGYYKPAMTIVEKKWREKAFKEGNIYVSDPEVITVKGVSSSDGKSDTEEINLGYGFDIVVTKQFYTDGTSTYGASLNYENKLFKYFASIPNQSKKDAIDNVHNYIKTLKVSDKIAENSPEKGNFSVYYNDRSGEHRRISDSKFEIQEFINMVNYLTSSKESSSENKSKNYILHADIKSVTVNQKGMKYTFKGSDVLNGANVLAKGSLLETKAIYIPKRDVISVELKDGSEVKPSNGYWIKKDASGEIFKPKSEKAEPQPKQVDLNSFEQKVKDALKVENKWHFISEEVGGKEVQLKMYVGKKEVDVQIFKINNISARMPKNYAGKRETLKMIMDNFKSNFETGGKVTFKQKANAIAKNFEGKRVEPEYQKEYGKTYDAKEAKEVGNKIAGAQKAKYDSKMSKGGEVDDFMKYLSSISNEGANPDKKDVDKIVSFMKNLGNYSSSETQRNKINDNLRDVVELIKNNKRIPKSLVYEIQDDLRDLYSKAESGAVVKRKSGNPKMKEAMILAKKIRKDGEKWTDAVKRAYAQVK